MIRRDYHGFRMSEAMADAQMIITDVREKGQSKDATFIVGHGSIRNGLIEMLKAHKLEPRVQMGNAGVIVCLIE